MTQIKFCGLMSQEDIESVNEVHPDYVGFVFVKERPRYIEPEKAKSLCDGLSDEIPAFGVFLGEPFEDIVSIAKMDFLDALQLHGDQSNRFIRMLRLYSGASIVKAFTVTSKDVLEEALASDADMILLDSGAGTGKTFDWDLLDDFSREYILAGGLNPDNVSEAIQKLHPAIVDTSSGIETDHRKDRQKMIQFKQAVEKADSQ